jgi:hypothetical protein
MNAEIDKYISEAIPEQKEIMLKIRELAWAAVPQLKEDFKWSRPIFGKNKDFAYLKTAKAYLTLGFYDASVLSDPDGKLEGTGKNMRHLKIKKVSDMDTNLIKLWFEQASANF